MWCIFINLYFGFVLPFNLKWHSFSWGEKKFYFISSLIWILINARILIFLSLSYPEYLIARLLSNNALGPTVCSGKPCHPPFSCCRRLLSRVLFLVLKEKKALRQHVSWRAFHTTHTSLLLRLQERVTPSPDSGLCISEPTLGRVPNFAVRNWTLFMYWYNK